MVNDYLTPVVGGWVSNSSNAMFSATLNNQYTSCCIPSGITIT